MNMTEELEPYPLVQWRERHAKVCPLRDLPDDDDPLGYNITFAPD